MSATRTFCLELASWVPLTFLGGARPRTFRSSAGAPACHGDLRRLAIFAIHPRFWAGFSAWVSTT